MKEMTDIYAGIEENLRALTPKVTAMKETVASFEKQIESLMAKQEAAETSLKKLQAQQDALIRMKEAAESADFPLKKPEIDKLTGATILQKPKKQIPWTKKNGTLIQVNRQDQQIATFGSQKAAARNLGWDQSSLSKFMKLDPETQIRKKGFAFKWVP